MKINRICYQCKRIGAILFVCVKGGPSTVRSEMFRTSQLWAPHTQKLPPSVRFPFVHQCVVQYIQLNLVQLAPIAIASPHPKGKVLGAVTNHGPTRCTYHQFHVSRPACTDLRSCRDTLITLVSVGATWSFCVYQTSTRPRPLALNSAILRYPGHGVCTRAIPSDWSASSPIVVPLIPCAPSKQSIWCVCASAPHFDPAN